MSARFVRREMRPEAFDQVVEFERLSTQVIDSERATRLKPNHDFVTAGNCPAITIEGQFQGRFPNCVTPDQIHIDPLPHAPLPGLN